MIAIERPSPNHEPRAPGTEIDMIVLHYTGMVDARAALDRLCDPISKVSAHYLIDEDGTLYALVPEDRRAWHAGVSYWAGARDINGLSIGIELHNPGHESPLYHPYPEAQMASLEKLLADILARRSIPRRRILGHSDVAPARKIDPGELFDWRRLARRGFGLWPEVATEGAGRGEPADPWLRRSQRALSAIGYEIAESGRMDGESGAVLGAFQRHFRPAQIDGILDMETVLIAENLARQSVF